jgi:beta-glucosidase
MPLKELKSFKRVHVLKGGQRILNFSIPVRELQKWDIQKGQWTLYPGDYRILVGTSSQDIRLNSLIKLNGQ